MGRSLTLEKTLYFILINYSDSFGIDFGYVDIMIDPDFFVYRHH